MQTTPEDKKIQAHGITTGQMKQLQYQQASEPGSIQRIAGNNAGDNITDPYFQKQFGNYTLPMHERFHYHVAVESRMFAPNGAVPVKTSTASVHKLSKEAYEFQKKHGAFNGQITHILHNPELEDPKAPLFPEEKTTNEASGQGGGQTDDKSGGGSGDNTGGGSGPGNLLTKEELEDMTVDEIKEIFADVSGKAAPKLNKAELIDELLKLKPVKTA